MTLPGCCVQAERERKTFALRADSDSLANSHNPADIAADRHHWLIFTVPETPVAGADCVVYFNKAQSETLRFDTEKRFCLYALPGCQAGGCCRPPQPLLAEAPATLAQQSMR